MNRNSPDDELEVVWTSGRSSLVNQVHPTEPSLEADTDLQIRRIFGQVEQPATLQPSSPSVVHNMSYPHPNFNPPQEQYLNQNNYTKAQEFEQYQLVPQFMHPMPLYGWYIQPAPIGSQLTHIQNPPKILDEENIAQSNNKAMEIQNVTGDSTSSPGSDHAIDGPVRSRPSKKERSKQSVIPTTKFINETFDFNRKKRTRKKSKAEKLPDPQLTELVKEVLKQYELNQKSLASDVGCSETMVSQWINGTSKATGWSDFEAKIRIWLNQEHKKPDKGPAFNFIDESSKLKTKFLRKTKK